MEIRLFWDFLDEYGTTTNNIHDVEVLERRYGYKMVPIPIYGYKMMNGIKSKYFLVWNLL